MRGGRKYATGTVYRPQVACKIDRCLPGFRIIDYATSLSSPHKTLFFLLPMVIPSFLDAFCGAHEQIRRGGLVADDVA